MLLAPMAPYVTEEMWKALGHKSSVHLESWPKFDPNLARDETVTVVVQVNAEGSAIVWRLRSALRRRNGSRAGAEERGCRASSWRQGAAEDHLYSEQDA